MKSVAEIAREMNVTPQALYKRIKALQPEFETHMHVENGKRLIDENGETLLRGGCKLVDNKVETVDNPVANQRDAEEIAYLREELRLEREHSRALADRYATLAEQLAELTRNNQLLLGAEQTRTNPALLPLNAQREEEPEEQQKKGFFSFFHRLKKNK